jgi:hypothetical protein
VIEVYNLKHCLKNYMDEHGWVADGDKIGNDYSSSRSVDIESLMSCVLFKVWVLFVCLQVNVFDVCYSM